MGSGIHYNKKSLKSLINAIIDDEVGRIVITHKDRLFEEDLAKDVLEIITVFSARLYGARSRKNQKLIDKMKEVVDDSTQD